MVPTRWSDWASAAEAAYDDLAARCEQVFVAGLSMGGSLAIWLAQAHPDIAGLVVVNPLVEPPAESFRDMLSGMLEEGAVSLPAHRVRHRQRRCPRVGPTTPRRSNP